MVVDEGSVATVGDRDPAIDGDAGLIELLAPLEYAYDLSVYCLLYTSDAADEGLGGDLGGRRIIKKKKKTDRGQ